ncbi:MAG: hypothetical protein U5J83_05265 [Bryobacterales bacterium]|nr:hypothetical protein [Bryobacterales bacterium]
MLILALCLCGCGAYMKLDGSIARVRVVETGGEKNVLVVEFDVTNTARIAYVVKEAELEIPSGTGTLMGDSISVRDAQTICRHVASLNHDCAQALVTREQIPPGATVRRMVAASFPKSVKELEERKGLLLRIRELDRMETEIRETR